MLAEDKSHHSDRFLSAITFVSNERIKLVLNRVRYKSTDTESVNAYEMYNDWLPQNNEILVYTTYAFADLGIPNTFDCIFQLDNPDHFVISNFQITHAVLDFGGHWPIKTMHHGHKHFCVLTFDQTVPEIFYLLKELGCGWDDSFDGLGLCDSSDFASIQQKIKTSIGLK